MNQAMIATTTSRPPTRKASQPLPPDFSTVRVVVVLDVAVGCSAMKPYSSIPTR